ncbi:hypothetical protein ABZ915_44755 [Streptomyces sp. NPDC046915]|uniref:hypothetical protein n=1 Tax=Streptomyces sp. NPDC046915 TaxID=3155257 RepID=UPI0033DD440C
MQPADIAVGRTATAGSEETSKANTAVAEPVGEFAYRVRSDGRHLHPVRAGTRIAWESPATNCYRIEGSTDNAGWTILADLTATTSTSQVQVSAFRAQARYVRVTVTGLPPGVWA